ncbi:hypothetical protein AVEN_222725-1 [Araneus ventricosus]|uniref:Transposase Tc1-like domain-containing protein n=1 Tax=Araneus ventricosus TaxID=182803 RepID=A0A4Y2B1N6_ARAVE|nr:hypothetical protein AVEN_222725-1 [Araneus ventricosus]
MLQAGARQSAAARELNVHRSVIHRLWNHYQRDRNASRKRGSGRRRITRTADDRYQLKCARRRTTLTARQLASQLSAAVGRPLSRQAVSRGQHEGGLFARRPVFCVPLSPAARQSAVSLGPWTSQLDTRAVAPRTRYGCVSIYHPERSPKGNDMPGTRYHAPNIVERDHYRSDWLLVWAG